jgi:hypothetical protein
MTHGRKHLEGFHQALNQSTELPWMAEAGSSVTAASTDSRLIAGSQAKN